MGHVEINYSLLPQHMQEGVRKYIEEKAEPGGFLLAVLSNDLVGAAARADDINRYSLLQWAEWLYHECPKNAWGSKEVVNAWLEGGCDGESN